MVRMAENLSHHNGTLGIHNFLTVTKGVFRHSPILKKAILADSIRHNCIPPAHT